MPNIEYTELSWAALREIESADTFCPECNYPGQQQHFMGCGLAEGLTNAARFLIEFEKTDGSIR